MIKLFNSENEFDYLQNCRAKHEKGLENGVNNYQKTDKRKCENYPNSFC